ncbi:hypothetical protein OPQ81_011266 [Rhizoctonia solani]|nr:hypothetical protein OPQ81_011266 [Rhizoctonia solani]
MGDNGGVGDVDPFTRDLWEAWKSVRDLPNQQSLHLGIFRSDYMLHQDVKGDLDIKQVEFNTISSSFGPLSRQTSSLHKYLAVSTGYFGVSPHLDPSNFPENDTLNGLVEGLAAAHTAYNKPSACILFVVQPNERNMFDQRWLEYELLDKYGIHVIRHTLETLSTSTTLDDSSNLLVKASNNSTLPPSEISVVYFRATYTPNDFKSPTDWPTRILLERSRAIKCPSLPLQLAGGKMIQAVLAAPGVLERFIGRTDEEKQWIPQLRDSWMEMWPLASSPQISTYISSLNAINISGTTNPQPSASRSGIERAAELYSELDLETNLDEARAWIAMRLIQPPKSGCENYLVAAGTAKALKKDTVSELGIFGWSLFGGEDTVEEKTVGLHVLKVYLSTFVKYRVQILLDRFFAAFDTVRPVLLVSSAFVCVPGSHWGYRRVATSKFRGVQAAFAKLGVRRAHDEMPYEPYMDPEPERRLRRASSYLSMRQRKPSIVQSACLSVHKIPAIVAVSGSPETPSPKTRLPSGSSSSPATRKSRHSIAGWHQLLRSDDIGTRYAFQDEIGWPKADAPIVTAWRTDRSNIVPAVIGIPTSFDFRDLDQQKHPYSAPSQQTTFRLPVIQVTAAERRARESSDQYTPQPTTSSHNFVEMDRALPAPLPVPPSSHPSPRSIHRSPSPVMGQSHRSVSPTVGHTSYYPGAHRRESLLQASHTPQRTTTPLQGTNSASAVTQATTSESYDFIGMDRPSPGATRENLEYGAYYCTSPMPISAYGSTHGTSRANTYESRQGGAYNATRLGTYALTRDTHDAVQQNPYDPTRPRGGLDPMSHEQARGLTTIMGEIEDYNQDGMRSVPAPSPSPTATISVDGTLDSPYGF